MEGCGRVAQCSWKDVVGLLMEACGAVSGRCCIVVVMLVVGHGGGIASVRVWWCYITVSERVCRWYITVSVRVWRWYIIVSVRVWWWWLWWCCLCMGVMVVLL